MNMTPPPAGTVELYGYYSTSRTWLGWQSMSGLVESPKREGAAFDPPKAFVLVLCKMLQVIPNAPERLSHKIKSYSHKRVLVWRAP